MKINIFNNRENPAAVVANERGVILVTVIMLLLILGLLIFTATQWAQMDIKRTKDYTKTREAFYIAETGLQRALNFLNFDASRARKSPRRPRSRMKRLSSLTPSRRRSISRFPDSPSK